MLKIQSVDIFFYIYLHYSFVSVSVTVNCIWVVGVLAYNMGAFVK